MAGGNDEEDDDFRKGFTQGIDKIMSIKSKTKVIVNALPPRYDRLDRESKIQLMNKFIHSEINFRGNWQNQNVQVNFQMEKLNRRFFTRHGLHLNNQGKDVFCDRMVKLLCDFEKSKKPASFLGQASR